MRIRSAMYKKRLGNKGRFVRIEAHDALLSVSTSQVKGVMYLYVCLNWSEDHLPYPLH